MVEMSDMGKAKIPPPPTASFVEGRRAGLEREYRQNKATTPQERIDYLKKKLNVRGGIAGCGGPSKDYDLAALEAAENYLLRRKRSARAAKSANKRFVDDLAARMREKEQS